MFPGRPYAAPTAAQAGRCWPGVSMRVPSLTAPGTIGLDPLPRATRARLFDSALQGYYLAWRLASDRRHPKVATMLRHRDEFYAQAWQEAARSVGASIEPLGGHLLRITRGSRQISVNRNYSPLDSQVSVMLADDKRATYRILREAAIPVPEHVVVTLADMAPARAFLYQARSPVVVKPAAGTGG